MKKIVIAFTTAIITLSLLCVTAFGAGASSVPFSNVLELQYSQVYQLEYGVDYEEYDGNSHLTVGVVPTQEAIAQGGVQYQAWNCIISYEGPDIKPFETVRFRLSWKMESSMPRPFSFREVVVRDYSKSQWDFAGQQSVGKISFTTGTPDLYACYSNISYTNTSNKTLTSSRGDNPLTFELCFKGSKPAFFRSQIQFFDANVTDFFIGDLNGPNAPTFDNPNEEYGGIVNDYNEKEDEILGSAEDGKEIFSNSMTWVLDALSYVAIPLSAIGRAFDYVFEELYWLHYLVRFSLAIGLVAYVLNIGASVFRSISRKKGGED